MKNANTHNAKILAEAAEHSHRDVYAFANEIDSFRIRLRKGDIVSANKLEVIGLKYLFSIGDYTQCLAQARRLKVFFEKKGIKEYEGRALLYIAMASMYLGNLEDTMALYIDCIEILTAAKVEDFKIAAEQALAELFRRLGMNDQCLTILHSHWSLAEATEDKMGMCFLGCTMANIYGEAGQMDQSKRKLDELAAIVEAGSINPNTAVLVWNEHIRYYLKIGKPAKAYQLYKKHLSGPAEFPVTRSIVLMIQGECLAQLGKYEEAEKAMRRTLAFVKSHNHTIHLTQIYDALIRILLSLGKNKDAAEMMAAMKREMRDNIGNKYKLKYERCCAYFYEKTNDSTAALAHYKKCMELEQAIQISENNIRFRALFLLSQEELKNKELNEIKNQLQMKRDELEVSAIYIKQHQAMLTELDSFMKELREDNKRKKNIFKEVHNKIKTLQLYDSDKKHIEDKINSEQQQYIVQIRTTYPALSNTEARICSLLRSGLSSKEIAALLIIDVHTVEQHRYRIRKKIGISKSDDLMMVLNQE